MATTGKIIEVLFENAIETHEEQMQMLDLVTVFKPDSANMQNANNFVWRPVQQNRPTFTGWDMTGNETDIIQETYPAVLGLPTNDIYEQRADAMRDMRFWEDAGRESGKKQATTLNKAIADMVVNTGSCFYQTNAVSGFDAIGESNVILKERQSAKDMAYVMMNDRDAFKYAKDLAGRETVKGRPESSWSTGQIGSKVATMDIFEGSFLPTVPGGAITATTTTAAVSLAPEGGTVDPVTGATTNVDYRSGTIPVLASAAYAVGDWVQFENTSVPVESIGLSDKSPTGTPMTFKIVSIPNGTSLEVFPKPIALDDAALSTLEKAYANINTQITSGATVVKVNTTASARANIFWSKDSIEVTGGDVPVDLLQQFGGMKVISHTMSNGQRMYMAYDGDIRKMTFVCRMFTWWAVTNKNPSANGTFTTF